MIKSDPPDPVLPDKLYFKIGEVSRIAGVPPYVLRFWEGEFRRIRPSRTPSGQRLYRRRDVELVLTVKHLLYDRKFTIEGARQFLSSRQTTAESEDPATVLDIVREELKRIRALLDQ